MTNNFNNSLNIALELLDKQAWATPLAELERNFHCIPEGEITFAEELLNLLWLLHTTQQADSDFPLNHVFAIRLAKLDAWTFRFSKITPTGKEFINPLVAVPSDFTQADVGQSGSAFPAEDIIKRWVRDHLV